VAPNGALVTQVILADDDGVFTYGVPFAGWWGFAALSTSDKTMEHEGKDKPVELGAVIWTEFVTPLLRK
jgi:cobalt/nickel transport protein